MPFNDRLQEAMNTAGHSTSYALAKSMRAAGHKATQQSIRNYLLGRRKPTLEAAANIAQFLGADLGWLAGLEQERDRK